jgi:hypothetical protein
LTNSSRLIADWSPFYRKNSKKIGDAFMGYHDDACAAIILHVCQQRECNDQNILQLEQKVCSNTKIQFKKKILLINVILFN